MKLLLCAAVSLSVLAGCKGDDPASGAAGDASTGARPAIPRIDPVDASAGATLADSGACGCTPGAGYVDDLPDGGAVNTYDAASAQVFTGYLESFTLPSGSDHLLVAITPDGTAGTVFFGDGPTLPPPSSPDVGYPPGANVEAPGTFLERFPFSVLRGARAGDRLTFAIDTAEADKQWCEIRTTVYARCNGTPTHEFLAYGCLPNAAFDHATGGCSWSDECGVHPVDCGKLGLCIQGSPCSCTSHGCTVVVGLTGHIAFDLQVQGNLATGSIAGLAPAPITVHLTATP